jgi:hypothetical protein
MIRSGPDLGQAPAAQHVRLDGLPVAAEAGPDALGLSRWGYISANSLAARTSSGVGSTSRPLRRNISRASLIIVIMSSPGIDPSLGRLRFPLLMTVILFVAW